MSGKRKHPGFTTEFKQKVSRLLTDKSTDLQLRPFKKMFPNEGFKLICLREDESANYEEQPGYLYCDNQQCRHKKTAERVS